MYVYIFSKMESSVSCHDVQADRPIDDVSVNI